MSEPKPWDLWEVILEETDSKWVRWEDYARLKAAFDLLDESIKLGPSAMPISRGYYFWKESEQYFLKEENARLKAQVERLTKAGDELGEWFMDIHPSKKKWNAAKEGKPRA
jgi:hypothetical protein